MYRTKWNLGVMSFFLICYLGAHFSVSADDDKWQYGGTDDYFQTQDVVPADKGKIYYFSTNVEVCNR